MDSPPPPTPSPPPRLRRSPKRQALHERTNSHTNEVLFPTIRPVTDADAKVYATRPFPTSERQTLAPRGPRAYPFARGAGDAGLAGGRGLGYPPNLPVSQSNATSLFATPRVQNPRNPAPRAINAKHAQGPAQFSHDGPGLEPFAAHTPHYPSSPPVEVTEKSYHSPSSGIDVDRLVMERGLNPNDDHRERPSLHLMPVAPATQSRSHGYLQSSSSPPSFVTPRTSSSIGSSSSSSNTRESRANLGAIANVASGLSYDSRQATPMSVGSAGSSGTVVRRRGFTGPTPPGFYTLFPLTPRPQSGRTRYSRSSSAPPRPDSVELSSPVSPLSPEDGPDYNKFARIPFSKHVHSSSETAIGGTPTGLDYKGYQGTRFTSGPTFGPPRTAQPDQPLPQSPSFQIPRKPVVGRSNAVRWNSYMSTIASESAEDKSSAGERSRIHSGATASSSLGAGFSAPGHPSLKTIGNNRLSRDFPLPEPLFSGKRTSRQRVTSGGSTIRMIAQQDGDLRPAPNDRVASLSSVYSHPDYRDSGSQTEAGIPSGNRGSMFRESIPAWARFYYSNEARNRQTIGLRDSALSGRADSRRHTVDSQYPCQDPLRIARNRPTRHDVPRDSYRDSMPITPLDPNSVFVGEIIRGDLKDRSGNNWSPHLWHSRGAAIKRRTMFQAPSIDERAEGRGLSRRNAQIWLFALGFIFPPAWILAAILPLPPMPRTPPASPAFEHDLEKTLGPIDQARYENARWWRNINRIMSVVGVGIIVAIIVLAVVASRTSS